VNINAAAILTIAAGLDYAIGDPWNWLHPVQVMGWGINHSTQFMLKQWQNPTVQRAAGVGLAIVTIGLSGLTGWLLVEAAQRIHSGAGIAVGSILLSSCLAGHSLRCAAEEVLGLLQTGELVAARARLSLYVGRDTQDLSEPEILRAVLETVTENATDGVLAPLFWAIVGSLTPIGSVPLALAYKAASTLDSMIGYRDPPYTYIGWCGARLEDLLTWLPCRLVVLSLISLSSQPGHIWKICRRDAPQDPSPNAGWSECAYAAMLDVQMGGTNYYRGVPKQKPLLGDNNRPITPTVIRQAMQWTRLIFLIWLTIGLSCNLFL
jgi:adenosylcobinamide-phosphate synthase